MEYQSWANIGRWLESVESNPSSFFGPFYAGKINRRRTLLLRNSYNSTFREKKEIRCYGNYNFFTTPTIDWLVESSAPFLLDFQIQEWIMDSQSNVFLNRFQFVCSCGAHATSCLSIFRRLWFSPVLSIELLLLSRTRPAISIVWIHLFHYSWAVCFARILPHKFQWTDGWTSIMSGAYGVLNYNHTVDTRRMHCTR